MSDGPVCAVCGAQATQQCIDGDWWLACLHDPMHYRFIVPADVSSFRGIASVETGEITNPSASAQTTESELKPGDQHLRE